jgi:hypothetical protein
MKVHAFTVTVRANVPLMEYGTGHFEVAVTVSPDDMSDRAKCWQDIDDCLTHARYTLLEHLRDLQGDQARAFRDTWSYQDTENGGWAYVEGNHADIMAEYAQGDLITGEEFEKSLGSYLSEANERKMKGE